MKRVRALAMLAVLLPTVAAATAAPVAAVTLAPDPAATVVPDAARERRWAEQIVPQLVVGDAVWLAPALHAKVLAIYTQPAKPARNAIVVVHGLGVNPDWNLIGVLRTELAELGYATLSLQMPVLAADARRDDYEALFPDAAVRLTAAVDWLRARDYTHVAVVSHSMGSAMVNAWLAQPHAVGVDAWVPIGLLVDFAAPPRLPVLDVVAERDFPEALRFASVRATRLRQDGCSAPRVVADADHYFERAASRLAHTIAPFLDRALGGGCRRLSNTRVPLSRDRPSHPTSHAQADP